MMNELLQMPWQKNGYALQLLPQQASRLIYSFHFPLILVVQLDTQEFITDDVKKIHALAITRYQGKF